jgi:oligoribonuclease NrnB/cAMP/cGMP phosphodiesterase (DHH superfamily)
MKNIVILYHAKCADGFGSAYAAWKKFGDIAEYIAVRDRKVPPAELAEKDVYILDFSYPSEVFAEIEHGAKSLTVIDHHKGVEKEVRALKNHVFDTGHSGAVLSWNYFHPSVPVPKLLAYIEDADIWKFELPHSREMSAAIHVSEFDFVRWETLVDELETA